MKKKLIKFIFTIIIFLFLITLGCNIFIEYSNRNQLFDDIKDLPHNKVGLILGTSKFLKNKKSNPYFKNRLEAAILLYKAKKIDFILVSGDNRKVNYNEPKQMTLYLLSKNIPNDRIIQDYGGRRTLDSVLRANLIFDLKQFTIVSQEFHNERAVFIANNFRLSVIAFNAKPVLNENILSLRNHIREYFARVKAVIDVLFKIQPAIGGKKEPILVS